MLAALGIYGLVSYSVRQRTREIGIRAALGATAGQIVRHVMARALALIGLGLVLGLALAVPVSRMLAAVMPVPGGNSVGLPLAVVAIFFVLVALVAGLIPARRATRVDPMIALRAE
jgi:ABC-type antimicrobial peptide transport system permease subunit